MARREVVDCDEMCERIDGLNWLAAACLHVGPQAQPTLADREPLPVGPGLTAEGEQLLAAIEDERHRLEAARWQLAARPPPNEK